MKPLFLVATMLAFDANSHQIRKNPSHFWQLTTVTQQCCTSKGGTLCGKVIVDCCKKGCETGYFDTQWCQDDQTFNPTDCDTCTNVCKKKGGIVCSTNVLTGTSIQCCAATACEGTVDKSCKAGSAIDVGGCKKDSIFELIKQEAIH